MAPEFSSGAILVCLALNGVEMGEGDTAVRGSGMRWLAPVLAAALLLGGCVSRPEPAPAVMRESAPPWDAPRDAISHIRAAGAPELGLGDDADPWILRVEVTVDGAARVLQEVVNDLDHVVGRWCLFNQESVDAP